MHSVPLADLCDVFNEKEVQVIPTHTFEISHYSLPVVNKRRKKCETQKN